MINRTHFLIALDTFKVNFYWDLPLTILKTEILCQSDPGYMHKHVCSLAGCPWEVGDLETFSISIINFLKTHIYIHCFTYIKYRSDQ